MHIKITWDQEFYDLMMYLIAKYGRDFLTLDGIGDQMDINKFSKDFFNTDTTTADVSVDSNANVCARTSIEYNHEMPKPIKKYNSYFLLWKQIKKDYGLLEANTIVEKVLRGDLYVNDSTDVALPYCFNYSTYDIALNGLEGVSKRVRVSAPKSLETFVRQVEQFMVVAANSTLGATGFADFLIVASLFVEKMKKIGYDGRIKVDDYKTYVKEKLINFIYTVNWEFRGNQSPFSNLSVFDRNFLESLCPDYTMDGKAANPETVHELQGLFLDAMNEEMRRTPLTFPVTTACFSIDDDRNIVDREFVKFIAEKNKEFGFINMYNGKMSTLSSCCRLRSDRKNEYFNSFGSGSTKIGSLGVVTANFPRLAMQSGGDESVFIDKLKDAFFTAAKINNAKRKIVQRRIDLGAAPLYTHGYMDITKQYSTFGVTGLYEAVSILGKDILNEDGQDLVMRTLEQINLWIDEAQELYQSPHNCEQVPAESSSVKLAKKDKVLGYDCGVSFYSNQFIPLIAKANMLDRIRLQGKFDGLFSGGAICHVNVGERIEDTKNIEDLIFYAAKSGVVYWAINYLLRICDDNHTWVGSDRCPVCGREWSEEITRVVGFFTNVKNWNKVRREKDRPNRQFYGKEEMRCE
jgi:ribonucleoside-triphosphate reductase